MINTPPLRLNIIGCGKLGRTLARLWADEQLIELSGICNRSEASACDALAFITASQQADRTIVTNQLQELPTADLWLIATPDGDIESTAEKLAKSGLLNSKSIVFHCSGSLASSILEPVNKVTSHTASVHPIHGFAIPEHSLRSFAGTFCAAEGDPVALDTLIPLFERINGNTFQVNTDSKPLYHAATAVASNYLVALLDAALTMLEKAGVNRSTARELIRPIVMQTAENVCRSDTTAALTGPISRGDISTIEKHIEALNAATPELLELYRSLGNKTVEIAKKQQPESEDKRPLKSLQEKLNQI